MLLAGAEFLQKRADGLGFRHEKGLAHDLGHRGMLSGRFDEAAQEILGVQNAHHVVAGVFVHGNAGMSGVHDDAGHFGQGHVVGHAVDIGAGDHGVLHLKIVEAQDAQQHGLLVRFHLAVGSGFKNGFFQGFFVVVPEKSAQARPDGTMTVGASVQNNLHVWARICGVRFRGRASCREAA